MFVRLFVSFASHALADTTIHLVLRSKLGACGWRRLDEVGSFWEIESCHRFLEGFGGAAAVSELHIV